MRESTLEIDSVSQPTVPGWGFYFFFLFFFFWSSVYLSLGSRARLCRCYRRQLVVQEKTAHRRRSRWADVQFHAGIDPERPDETEAKPNLIEAGYHLVWGSCSWVWVMLHYSWLTIRPPFKWTLYTTDPLKDLLCAHSADFHPQLCHRLPAVRSRIYIYWNSEAE